VRFRAGQKAAAISIIQKLTVDDPDRAEYYRRREAYFES